MYENQVVKNYKFNIWRQTLKPFKVEFVGYCRDINEAKTMIKVFAEADNDVKSGKASYFTTAQEV